MAILTVVERIADAFVGWFPMYGELKLALFIYLWYPKTMVTTSFNLIPLMLVCL